MPQSRAKVLRTTLLLIGAGGAILAVIVAASLWLSVRTQTFANAVAEARAVRIEAADLRSAAQDAESGQRGFLLTQNEAYLAPYTAGRGAVADGSARLRALLKDDPAARPRIERLDRALGEKLAELAQTIDQDRAGHRDEAMATVNTGRGKALMDEIRTVLAEIIAGSEAQLDARSDEQQRSVAALQWAILIGAVLIVLVVGGSMIVVTRYTRDLVAARQEVDALNVGLEERVADRTRDLSQANEEIQRFAYIVSHDLRAPLVNIMGFASEIEEVLPAARAFLDRDDLPTADPSLAEARAAVRDDLPEAIGFIRASTDKMDRLIKAILKLSREGRRRLEPEPVELRPLLETAVASVQHQVGESGGTIRVEGAPLRLTSDRVALEQIVGNLVDNAVKYRRPGQPIEMVLTSVATAKGVTLSVADKGRGIAAQDLERIFEIFRRAGVQDTQGEGLGLAYVRALARRLGGEVTVTSALGEGSTFRVTLARDVRDIGAAA